MSNKNFTTLARLLISRLMSISSRARNLPSASLSRLSKAKRTDKAIAVNFASLKYDCGLGIGLSVPSFKTSEISRPINGVFRFCKAKYVLLLHHFL